jgi:beta-ureidopropionase / N-carbamoyl-L-amino-acid hydrolase
MARIGATEAGGVTRLTLSDEDREARDLLRRWCEEDRRPVEVDDLGNMYCGRLSGDAVLCGSHLDSVARGGRFDGVLGVLAGLEVLRSIEDAGTQTRRPVALVNFTNEEGARFEPAMMSSGVLAGAQDFERVYATRDRDGLVFGEELERIGYRGDRNKRLKRFSAYFELHIEQGPVLEAAGIPVGVVTGIQGIQWCEVAFSGQQSHAGATPMDMRRDPLAAAARFISGVRELARRSAGTAATIGRLRLVPDIINVIPGRVELGLDLRSPEGERLDQLLSGARSLANRVAAEESVEVEFEPFWRSEPTLFDGELVDSVERSAKALGVETMRLLSGPGHDAKYMAGLGPAAMVFVRTLRGRSHCEDEDARWEDCEAAANVLLRAVVEAAG